jgi:branched chain amino acid aminotransferase (EC 2.6.1.42)
MATNWKFLPIAFLQGQFIPFVEAKLSIAVHALHYGTAAFGGLRVLLLIRVSVAISFGSSQQAFK